VFGTPYLDIGDTASVKGDGMEFIINFTRRGWLTDSCNFTCKGELVNEKLYKVTGKWNEALTMDGTLVWQKKPPVPDHRYYYYMSHFSMQLNRPNLNTPPTDSRHRPD
jgi:hypothetical protein